MSFIRGLIRSWTLIALSSVPLLPALAGTVQIPGFGAPLDVKVTSYKEARFQTVLKQEHDFSCGSAALASLLSFHYQDPVSEQQVFEAMFAAGDQERIRRQGFSLLDMRKYLSGRGYKADGFRIALDLLADKASVPAIVLINTNGYRHFVLVKGVTPQRVLVGDPALGIRAMDRAKFEESWDGMVFLIRSHADLGRANFNLLHEWEIDGRPPFGTAFVNEGLSNFLLLLPRQHDF